MLSPGIYRAHALPSHDMVAFDQDEQGRLVEKWRIRMSSPEDRRRTVEGLIESVARFRAPVLKEHERRGDVYGRVLAVDDRGEEGVDLILQLDSPTDREYVSVGAAVDREHNEQHYDIILWEVSLVGVPHNIWQRPMQEIPESEASRYLAAARDVAASADEGDFARAPDTNVAWVMVENRTPAPTRNTGGHNTVEDARAAVVADADESTRASESMMSTPENEMEAKVDALMESMARIEAAMTKMAEAMAPKEDPEAEAETEEEPEAAASYNGAEAAASAPAAATTEPANITAHPEFVRMRRELDEARAHRNRVDAEKLVGKLYEERALDEGQRGKLIEIAASGPEGIKAIQTVASAAPIRERNAHRGRVAEASGPPADVEAASKVYEVAEGIQRERIQAGKPAAETAWTSCVASAQKQLGLP